MDRWASLIMLGALVLLPVLGLVIAYLFRRLEHQERLRAIEKGLSLAVDRAEIALRTRRSGLTLMGTGLGVMLGSMIAGMKLGSHMVAGMGLGVIPLMAGLGLLLDYRLQRREENKEKVQ